MHPWLPTVKHTLLCPEGPTWSSGTGYLQAIPMPLVLLTIGAMHNEMFFPAPVPLDSSQGTHHIDSLSNWTGPLLRITLLVQPLVRAPHPRDTSASPSSPISVSRTWEHVFDVGNNVPSLLIFQLKLIFHGLCDGQIVTLSFWNVHWVLP